MPLLGALFLGAFTKWAEMFAAWVSKKTAFALAAVTTFGVLTAGIIGAMAVAFDAVRFALPESAAFQFGLWFCLPNTTLVAVSTAISFDSALALYRWNVENLKLASYVT